VEPIDQRTRDALQKSVQLAIEITTKSQEAFARHKAQKSEQLARGNLEINMIHDEAAAEKEKQELLRLRAHTESVKASGQATAEARARAEAAEIEAQAAVEQSALQAKAMLIDAEAELDQLMKQQEQEIEHKRALNELEVKRANDEAKIESEKFRRVVSAITPEAIASIAAAGPEMQAKLLGGLGLESVLITNGTSPVSLFSTAQGMISTTPRK
jgi:major vault protein